jgi:hypothetical protein
MRLLDLHDSELFLGRCIGFRIPFRVTFLKLLDEPERFYRAFLCGQEFYEAKVRWHDQWHVSNLLCMLKRMEVFVHRDTRI